MNMAAIISERCTRLMGREKEVSVSNSNLHFILIFAFWVCFVDILHSRCTCWIVSDCVWRLELQEGEETEDHGSATGWNEIKYLRGISFVGLASFDSVHCLKVPIKTSNQVFFLEKTIITSFKALFADEFTKKYFPSYVPRKLPERKQIISWKLSC